jgi:DNA polymerase III epsilon subunit-like protein
MKYVSLDLETTGVGVRSPDRILMISMVVEDTKNHEIPADELPHFTAILEPSNIQGEPCALAMNAWIMVAIEFSKTKMSVEKFFSRYSDLGIAQPTVSKGIKAAQDHQILTMDDMVSKANVFLNLHFGTKDKITVAGKNAAGFDLTFLPTELKDRFRHSVIDPGTLFWNPNNDRMLPHSDEVMKRAGVDHIGAHDALEDARMVVLAIRNSPFYLLEEAISLIPEINMTTEPDRYQRATKLIYKFQRIKGER